MKRGGVDIGDVRYDGPDIGGNVVIERAYFAVDDNENGDTGSSGSVVTTVCSTDFNIQKGKFIDVNSTSFIFFCENFNIGKYHRRMLRYKKKPSPRSDYVVVVHL